MMMCDSSLKEAGATSKPLVISNSKQMTSIKLETSPNPPTANQTNSNNNHHKPQLSSVGKSLLVAAAAAELPNGNGIVVVKQEQTIKGESDDLQVETTNGAGGDDSMTESLEYTFKPYSNDDSCDLNPEFAVICSFITQFGDKLDLTLDIEQLKSSIEDQSKVDESLIDLHVKLLKKVRRYFVRDLWEKALIRYVSGYSYEDAYEMEFLGYQKTRPSIKLQLLRRLMDAQFEHDQKFKPAVNLCEANELRIVPTGRDLRGNTYWHQTDSNGKLRIFQEQPFDYKSWKTVCSNTTELNNLIGELDTFKDERIQGEPFLEPYDPLPEIFTELFVKEETIEEEAEVPAEKSATKTKKGRGNRSRGKKNTLPALKEIKGEEEGEEEEDSNSGLKTNSSIEQQDNNVTLYGHTDSIRILKSESPDTTIESQVKSTLENLINKVVEYVVRPFSKNSTGHTDKEEMNNEPAPIEAPKKRATKRDKPKEDVLPRRSSSRIQQIQQKKQAEQEEEIKKMIESNTAKKTNPVMLPLNDDSRSRSISSRTNKKRSESPEDDSSKSNKKKRKKGQSWRRGKGKKRLSWDKDDSDLSSTSSVTESNDDEDDELDFQDNTFNIEPSDFDDEFACEDEETNNEPVIIKRARTARQNLVQDREEGDLNESSIVEEDKPCRRCDKSDDPEWILLCDMCDDGYHTSCCLPPLMIVPDGDWFCPPCEHKTLLTKLREILSSINIIIEQREREQKKAQRIRQANAKKEPIRVEPVEEIVDTKRQRDDFLNELNEPLALQELDDEIAQLSEDDESSDCSYKRKKTARSRTKKRGRATKKTANKRPVAKDDDEELDFSVKRKRKRKSQSRRNEVSDDDDESEMERSSQYSSEKEEEEEEPVGKQKTRRARACVSYRFQEYDELIQSAIQGDQYDEEEEEEEKVKRYDDEDDEEASERESSPDTGNYGRGKDMATIEALAYQQENGILEQNLPTTTPQVNTSDLPPAAELNSTGGKKPRKKARRLNDLDAASESGNTTSDESFQASSATEAEDDDDDDMTEAEISEESETSIDELISSHYAGRSKNKKMTMKKKKKRRESYESDDSEYQPTRSRRAVSKRVSYKESTEDEEEELLEPLRNKTKKKNTLLSDDESEVSWKSEENESNTPNEDDDNGDEDEDDDRSTSCAESPEMNADLVINEEVEEAQVVVTPSVGLDMGQTMAVANQETPEKPPLQPPVQAAPLQKVETLQPPAVSHVAVVKRAKIENSTFKSLPNTSVITICSSLDDSFDEIAAPFYTNLDKPSQPLPPLPPASTHHPHQRPPTTAISSKPEQQQLSRVVDTTATSTTTDKGRDPIKELIQYCNESANSAAMFDSYNQTLSSQKNHPQAGSPAHPTFYEDDELK